jgi:hypothetical protein
MVACRITSGGASSSRPRSPLEGRRRSARGSCGRPSPNSRNRRDPLHGGSRRTGAARSPARRPSTSQSVRQRSTFVKTPPQLWHPAIPLEPHRSRPTDSHTKMGRMTETSKFPRAWRGSPCAAYQRGALHSRPTLLLARGSRPREAVTCPPLVLRVAAGSGRRPVAAAGYSPAAHCAISRTPLTFAARGGAPGGPGGQKGSPRPAWPGTDPANLSQSNAGRNGSVASACGKSSLSWTQLGPAPRRRRGWARVLVMVRSPFITL